MKNKLLQKVLCALICLALSVSASKAADPMSFAILQYAVAFFVLAFLHSILAGQSQTFFFFLFKA
jgi:hypothetical protein